MKMAWQKMAEQQRQVVTTDAKRTTPDLVPMLKVAATVPGPIQLVHYYKLYRLH